MEPDPIVVEKNRQSRRLKMAIGVLRTAVINAGREPIIGGRIIKSNPVTIVDGKEIYRYQIRVAYRSNSEVLWNIIADLSGEDRDQVLIDMLRNFANGYGIPQDM